MSKMDLLLVTGKDWEAGLVGLQEGIGRIHNEGVLHFFGRVEGFSEHQFEVSSMPQKEYLITYDTIFQMCIQREPYNFSANLYEEHSKALVRYFTDAYVPVLEDAKQQHGLVFLRAWVRRWQCGKWAIQGMDRMFMYLNRFHVPNSEDLLTTTEQGFTLFKRHVFEQFKSTARDAILMCIHRERTGEEQDRDLLKESISVFVELGSKLQKDSLKMKIYQDDLANHLVAETRDFYQTQSRCWLDERSCPDYLIQAEACVMAEQGRLQSYIDKSSSDRLLKAVRDELLKNHQEELLGKDTGINRMFERTHGADAEAASDDLSRLFRLYVDVDSGLQNIAEAMRAHIRELGLQFIDKSKEAHESKSNGAQDNLLIRQLIELHERFLNLVRRDFRGDQMFHAALKTAFEECINRELYTSNYLARFANEILKKGSKIPDCDLENTMDHVVMLYGYIRDKDVFERDYQQYLSHRLLQALSQNEQAEKSMIGKLKTASGYHWTAKLEDMFKDIQRSKELVTEFDNAFSETFEVELAVSICTTGSWPTSSIPNVALPEGPLSDVSERFREYYLNRHTGRKLKYRMDQGKADVRVRFSPQSEKLLVVTTYQMLILLLFNQQRTVRFEDILRETNIPRDELLAHLLSLVHPQIKVLRKKPNGKNIEDDHQFQINPRFANPRARVIVPLMARSQKQTTEEQEKDMKAIIQLRRHQMDAAIVRIMKARGQARHADLVPEVVRQLQARFMPKPSDIKKRIANLIEQEYLERDENARDVYHYKM